MTVTDTEPTRWAGGAVDAVALPYADGPLANVVMLDVRFHAFPGEGVGSRLGPAAGSS